MGITWLYTVVPWLAILACPLLMMWMMHGGMSGARRDMEHTAAEGSAPAHGRADVSTEAEIEELRTRLAQLERRREREAVSQ